MVTRLEVDASQIEKLLRRWPQYEDIILDTMDNTMVASLSVFENEVAGRTPVGATGEARQSIQTLVRGRPPEFEGQVAIGVTYGLPLERGRRPGRQPPVEAIELWVRRKLGIQGDEAQSVAFLIARAIGRRGTQGAAMFQKGFEAGLPEVERLWQKAGRSAAGKIDAEVRKINQGL